jgi:hypothetical protein
MSVMIYDQNDFVGDLSSNKGLSDLHEAVEKKKRTYPHLHEFLQEGITFITEELMIDVTLFIKKEKNGDVMDIVRQLRKLLIDSTSIAVITSNISEPITTENL